MLRSAFLMLCCFISLTHAAAAQSRGSISSGIRPPAATEGSDPLEGYRQEMLKDLRIKRDEMSFKQTLERAKENAQLGTELLDQFTLHQMLSVEDLKKLSRMEKLSRQIRGDAGGSDDKTGLDDAPREIGTAVKKLAELSDELNKKVEKMTRHVVSAAVIQQTNELVALIRYVRSFAQ